MSKDMYRRSEYVRDIEFSINGKRHVVSDKFPPYTTLNDYIRDVAGLKGTKVMCREAGCGTCAVTVTRAAPLDKDNKADTLSINSCLCPLYSVDGWQISTVEGIGTTRDGLHPIQDRLGRYNATQCGFCTPGIVMSLYGLLHQKPNATQHDIEDSLDGHVCRCTGYRPILDAIKTFASDSSMPEKCLDIEDLNKHLCPKTGEACRSKGEEVKDKGFLPRSLSIDLLDDRLWYRPLDLQELSGIIQNHTHDTMKMFYGNSSAGLFKPESRFKVYVDLKAVKELHTFQETETEVIFGGGTTVTELKMHLTKLSSKPGFHYCDRMDTHLKGLASTLVRNIASIGGRLMIKYNHPEFPSDLFVIMEAVGALVHIYDSHSQEVSKMTLVNFLTYNMKDKVLLALEMPQWKTTDHFQSFKISPRIQNSLAYVNAAFKLALKDKEIVEMPSIVVGGINKDMVHATNTEEFLTGKVLDDNIINDAVRIMSGELNPSEDPRLASSKYRKDVATHLLYKTLLEVYKPDLPSLKSGAECMERPLSSGFSTFQEKAEEFPLKQALTEKTAPFMVTGEAEFVGDIPNFQHELSGALVGATIAVGHIKSIDVSEAMCIPGVVRFIDAKDIPMGGLNNSFPSAHPFFTTLRQELFPEKEIHFEGQVIGLILAESQFIAQEAAGKVKVEYENVSRPLIDLEDAIEKKSFYEQTRMEHTKGDTEAALQTAKHVVEGEVREGMQYHYYIEPMTGLAIPREDGVDIHITTQFAAAVHDTVSQVLGKPRNYINVTVPRLGGSFGGKEFNSFSCASMCALGAELTGRPVRLVYDLSSNMKVNERRFALYVKYKAGCDANGKMVAVDMDVYLDSGFLPTTLGADMETFMDQGFYVPNWAIRRVKVKTNKSMAGAVRGPGSVPASLIIETIMEHMAKEAGQHPILFKEINIYQQGQEDIQGNKLDYCSLPTIWKRIKQTADVPSRMGQVEAFNKNNLWRKKGITMCAVKYRLKYIPGGILTSVSIFAGDGTVTVSTSGVEMGQGLYMKVAQAVAKTLGLPIDKVKVRPHNNNFMPNSTGTGASTTSERAVAAAIAACQKIMEGVRPLKEKMEGAPWPEILTAATFSNIPLFATVDATTPGPDIKYFVYIVGVMETEVDILTGEYQISRADIMADFGESMNPLIDLGQVEGAFILGMGAYLSEDHNYDKSTGRLLNDTTWGYIVPTAKDIPIDWRIHFLPDAPNPNGILGSRATGEPPMGLAIGALLAIKASVENAREQLSCDRTFINVDAPFTVEKVQQAANIQLQHLRTDQAISTFTAS